MNNIWLAWGDVFNASLLDLWRGFIQFAPRLVLAIVLFIIGWVISDLIAKAFEHVFRALKIDNLLRSIGTENFLRKAGMNLNTGHFIGEIVRWFVIIIFLLPSLNLVGLNSIASFLQNDVLGFLPKVIISVFVLIIATIVADFLSKTVMAGSRAMNLTSASMLSSLVKYTVWVFAFIIALGQLGVAEGYMNTLFAGMIGMFAVAGALAFGLGGKDAAARLISKLSEEMSRK
jgi:small-conductance mechanosensitive channel